MASLNKLLEEADSYTARIKRLGPHETDEFRRHVTSTLKYMSHEDLFTAMSGRTRPWAVFMCDRLTELRGRLLPAVQISAGINNMVALIDQMLQVLFKEYGVSASRSKPCYIHPSLRSMEIHPQ